MTTERPDPMQTGHETGSRDQIEGQNGAQEPLNAPSGSQAPSEPSTPPHGTQGAHDEAATADASATDTRSARQIVADLLWWIVPGSTDEEAKTRANELLDAYAAEVRAEREQLESAAVHARSALAALCYDLEDPGSNALGALYLLSQATLAVDAPADDTGLALARHSSQVLHKVADMADPEPPEVSFFGPTFGPQVADWLRMLADSKAVTA